MHAIHRIVNSEHVTTNLSRITRTEKKWFAFTFHRFKMFILNSVAIRESVENYDLGSFHLAMTRVIPSWTHSKMCSSFMQLNWREISFFSRIWCFWPNISSEQRKRRMNDFNSPVLIHLNNDRVENLLDLWSIQKNERVVVGVSLESSCQMLWLLFSWSRSPCETGGYSLSYLLSRLSFG